MYANDLVQVRLAQRERYKGVREKHSSNVQSQNHLIDSSQPGSGRTKMANSLPKHDYTTNIMGTQKKDSLTNNRTVVSLAEKAKNSVTCVIETLSNTLLGKKMDAEDEKLIQKLKKEEIRSRRNRKLRQNIKKWNNLDKIDIVAGTRLSSSKQEENDVRRTALFSVVLPDPLPIIKKIDEHVDSHVYGNIFRLFNEDMQYLYSSIATSKNISSVFRKHRNYMSSPGSWSMKSLFSGYSTKGKQKNRSIKQSCFTTIQKICRIQLIKCGKQILNSAWYSSISLTEIESSFYYDKMRSSSQSLYHLYIDLSSAEKSSSVLTLRVGIPKEIVRIVIPYSKIFLTNSPVRKKDSEKSNLEDRFKDNPQKHAFLPKEKGQLFIHSLAQFAKETQIIILMRAGEAAFVVFQESEPVFSKVIKKYVTRKSQGHAQVKNDGAYHGTGSLKMFQKSDKKQKKMYSYFDELKDDADTCTITQEQGKIRFVEKKQKSAGRLTKACRSVGSQIRRNQYQEFIEDSQTLLSSDIWVKYVKMATLIWIASSCPSLSDNVLYTPHCPKYLQLLKNCPQQPTTQGSILQDDPKVHKIPISTRKPSFTEACRCFIELNSAQLSFTYT